MKSIPGFNSFVITNENKILNIRTGRILQGSVNGAGYRFYHLTDNVGKERNVGEHRLIALAYYGKPENEDMVVNHKDGDKLNNDPSNLEWCTQRENCIHAGKNGLSSKACSVQVRNVLTKEVFEFDTMLECSQFFGISKDAVSYRCRFGQIKIFPGGWQYRTPASDEVWFDNEDLDFLLLDKAVIIKDLRTKEEKPFDKLQDAAEFLGITPGGLTAYFKRSSQPVVKDFYQLKKTTDKNDWQEPKILNVAQQIRVTDSLGKATIYPTARAAAKDNNITPTTLDYRLSLEGKKIFKDGKRYERIQPQSAFMVT